MNNIALCTIISKNYLAYARTLCQSFISFHPNTKVFVLIADQIDNYFDKNKEFFHVLEAKDLGIPDFKSFSFKYDILEFNTAVKPYLLEYLFTHHDIQKLIYLDPDVLVTASLEPLFDLMNEHSILLTPHLTRPYQDNNRPREVDIMRTGSYNLGCIGLAKSPTVADMLKWWKQRCYEDCVIQLEDGFFVDQRWVDLVPGYFPNVHIIRDPGYNMAYWNLHERKYETGKEHKVNGKSLHFFHFSGFEYDNFENISKHQNRFILKDLPELRSLFIYYNQQLKKNHMEECIKWPYAFGYFSDGSKIHPIIRRQDRFTMEKIF